jgi:phospholipid-binding lipoprotein MlaA
MKRTIRLSAVFKLVSRRKVPAIAGLFALFIAAGCAPPPAPQGINDPDEAQNREIHQFNIALDRTVLKPLSGAYGSALPPELQRGVANFSDNLDLPGDVVNNLLQGRPHFALTNTWRFAINSTVGIGGLFDVSSLIGLHAKKTDFGETLHVWGAPEGAYIELPGLGPSTDRDAVGTIVDMAMNPLGAVLPDSRIATVAKIASKIGDRSRFSSTVDSILYDSADSYVQARLLYLQNRRFELGQTGGATTDEEFLDPYEDPYAE